MKTYIQFKTDAILLSAESKPYDFDGKSGVSTKVRLSVGGEIYPCNATEDQVQSLQKNVGDGGEAVVELVSRKENIKLKLVSFVAEE